MPKPKVFRSLAVALARPLAPLITRVPWLRRMITKLVVNRFVYSCQTRPHPLCTGWDYPNWDGLTDRRFSGRHLPTAARSYVDSLPDIEKVKALFERQGDARLSRHSTDLLANFAQWFTDGFLRTASTSDLQNTSNHEIDVSPLYGRTQAVTDALREGRRGPVGWKGGEGRLKSQKIGNAEFPPYFFRQEGYEATLERFLSAKSGLDPHYDDPNKTPEERVALKAMWHGLFEDLVAPGFLPIADEIGLIRTEREFLVSARPEDRARIKNRFAHGVERANNQFGYVAFNTLFLREHNRLAGLLCKAHRSGDDWQEGWDDERVFQTARNTLIVMLIRIVIEEYIWHISQLPFPLLADASPFYGERWYRTNRMTVEFNLLYRWHSLVPDSIDVAGRSYSVENFVFNNGIVLDAGIAAIFDAFSRKRACDIGLLNTTHFLVKYAEGASIRVGRSARLQPYNAYRRYVGLEPARTFADINSDPEIQKRLQSLYGTPDKVEFYVGLFAEDKSEDAVLPELITMLVAIDAFSQALTNPLLSEHVYKPSTFAEGWDEIGRTTSLCDIVLRNIPEYHGDTASLRISMSADGL